tara:strand:+ start:461 stop:2353 length:1893 start_codon:yes stop_codon:yes gene_type:complete
MATGNTIDELVIQIKADTKQLQSQLKKLEGKIRITGAAGGAAFGAGAGGLGGKLKNLKGPAMAATAAVVGIGVAISKVAKVGMEFEDLKDSLDVVFGSMEAGSAAMDKVFQFAQTTPFQIETATKAFIALKSAGIEPSMDMLQTFADTASVSVDQLGTFNALIRTVQRSASGGMGLEELNMISDRGIDVLGILSRKLGLGKDDIAQFGKSAEGAAILVEALTEGLKETFGGAMDTKMDNLSTKASNMTIAFKQLGDQLYKSGLGDQLKIMADAMGALAQNIATAMAASRGEGIGIILTGNVDIDLNAVEQEILEAEERLKKIRNQKQSARGAGNQDNTEKRYIAQQKVIENLEKTHSKLLDSYILEFDIIKKITDGQKNEIMEKGKLLQQFTFLQTEIKKLAGDTEILSESQKNLGIIFKENELKFAEMGIFTLPELEEAYKKVEAATSDLATTFDDELKQAVISQSQAFSKEFVDALMDGENALDSFKNFAKDMVSQIIAIFLQMAVVNEILNAVFKLDGTSAELSTFRNKKAGGGAVQAGQPVTVGERGAEIFVPNTGGKILNNMNSKNAMGGGGTVINQSINFAVGVVPTVRAEVMKMMPQIAEVTKGAVADAAMRGGNFRRALQGG